MRRRTPILAGVLCLLACGPVEAAHYVTATVMTESSGRVLADRSANHASHEEFAALPSRSALGRRVWVWCPETGRCAFTTVRDVGPWSEEDRYWVQNGRPLAEKGQRFMLPRGRPVRWRAPTNDAGIDLSLAFAKRLGVGYNKIPVVWGFSKDEKNPNSRHLVQRLAKVPAGRGVKQREERRG